MSMSEVATRMALLGMVYQFAYWSEKVGGFQTGGLSALEEAFDVLGWSDPHPAPDFRCDIEGCMRQATCGWPTPIGTFGASATGYVRGCGEHYREAHHANRG